MTVLPDTLKRLKVSSRLVVNRALARGWVVEPYESNPSIMKLTLPSRAQPIHIFSAAPPHASYVASKIAQDKFITNKILADRGVPVPAELLLHAGHDLPQDAIDAFLAEHKRIIVKPLDASHGKGITTDITAKAALRKAISVAQKQAKTGRVLLQNHLEGLDLRVLCVGYKFISAIHRTPARVIGDGRHTVAELIDVTNEDRGENYSKRLNKIPSNEAEGYLGKKRYNSVPAKQEIVQVLGVANVGKGGELQNVTTEVPQFLIELSEAIARTLFLPVCGIDFLIAKLPTKDVTKQQLHPVVIEVNETPMLMMYEDTESALQDRVIDAYLDFIETSE
ncbi:MAG: cyanophycin synthetase [Candidatus Saccharibacteria bacterium]|nr:cyanophycin synthetase [Candidatus Saccharibacteria bacterium]